MLEKIEAKLVPPRKWLSAIVDDTDDEAVVKEKQEKALAEHVALHPECRPHGCGLQVDTVGDRQVFSWLAQ